MLDKVLIRASIFALLGCLPLYVNAATFAPTTAAQLQADLTTAASNGEDDTITLAASTTYSASDIGATFTFSSVESNSLTLTGAGAGSTILDGGNAFRVMILSATSASVTVSGITFQNGSNGAGSGSGLAVIGDEANIQNCVISHNVVSSVDGAGIYVSALTGNLTFSNNTVSDNQALGVGGNAGGAILVMSSPTNTTTATVEGNTFSGNTSAAADYGALLLSTPGNVVFNNNTISSNTAASDYGAGAVVSTTGSLTLSGNTVLNNTATANGTGGLAVVASGSGSITFNSNTVQSNTSALISGGVTLTSGTGEVSASGNTISGNSTTGAGSDYAGLLISTSGNVSFTDNTVSDNTAIDQYGGGVIVSTNGSITCTGNTFSSNNASSIGGVGVVANSGLSFSNNMVVSNEASGTYGAGLFVNSSTGDVQIMSNLIADNTAGTEYGGAVMNDASSGSASTFSLINNTVYNNATTSGNYAGIYVIASDSSVTLNAYNNILFGNTNDGTTGVGEDAFLLNSNGNLNIFNNDIGELCFSSPASCDVSTLGADAGSNLSNVDPVFIDASNGNFRLQANSPLIDVGDLNAPGLPAEDVIGNPRSFLTIPDIGAYEAVPEISSSSTSVDFGSVSTNDASTVVITLSNNGSYAMNVTGMTLSDTGNFALQTGAGSDPCGGTSFSLASGDSCTLGIEFGPDSEGTINGTLDIASDAPANPSYTVDLTGVGTAGGGGCSMQVPGGTSAGLAGLLSLVPLAWAARLRVKSR